MPATSGRLSPSSRAMRGHDGEKHGSLSELADDRADDIGIIVGPDPLVRIELLQRPKRRMGKRAEILVVAGERRNRTDIEVFARVLDEVRAIVDPGVQTVGGRDAA